MSVKVKILDEQLDKAIYKLLSEDSVIINESTDLTKTDIEQISKGEIKKFFARRSPQLEASVKEVVKTMVKNDSDVEKAMVDIAKNVLVQLYKALWTKRGMWVNDLKNTAS